VSLKIGVEDIAKIFNQAWLELHCPPVKLRVGGKSDGGPRGPAAIYAVNGEVYVRPDIVPRGCDPHKYLLWYFRHELAHAHYCPYDLKTAYSLEKAAYSVTGNWDLAYLATHLFADLQVNINYLPRKFGELPYFMKVLRNYYTSILDYLLYEVYLHINPISKPSSKAIENVTKEMLAIILLDKPWHSKVQMLAITLTKLKTIRPSLFFPRRMREHLIRNPLMLREDLLPGSLKSFEEIFGSVSTPSDAREFFRQWIEPRLPPEEKEKVKKMMEGKLSSHKTKVRAESDKKEAAAGKRESEKKQGGRVGDNVRRLEFFGGDFGEEPRLPSSLSKPYEKIPSDIFNEAFWKRYWYKSRAERILMRYLSENPIRRPVWAVVKYPDDWYIEDEIEDLDIDVSLDEGPLIPEVTTLRWVEEPTYHGQSLIIGFVPSAIIILDASLSMLQIHDDAAIAAFIAYLSARRSGGQTSAITFSTKYVSADWSSPEELKELVLSMAFNEYTIFPINEVGRLVFDKPENCFITIITDGGWQNIDEAIPFLERMADLGHKIVIFLLPGGKYPDKVKAIKSSPNLRVYNVVRPEADLQGMVLSESVKTYKAFLS